MNLFKRNFNLWENLLINVIQKLNYDFFVAILKIFYQEEIFLFFVWNPNENFVIRKVVKGYQLKSCYVALKKENKPTKFYLNKEL